MYTIDPNSGCASAGAGVTLMPLGRKLIERGYSEFRYMGLIPGTIGGAVCMNAGATEDGVIENQFAKALIFDPKTLCFQEREKDVKRFGNRSSRILSSKNIVVKAPFALSGGTKTSVEAAQLKYKDAVAHRRQKQPGNKKNFGSTFKIPKEEKPRGGPPSRQG